MGGWVTKGTREQSEQGIHVGYKRMINAGVLCGAQENCNGN